MFGSLFSSVIKEICAQGVFSFGTGIQKLAKATTADGTPVRKNRAPAASAQSLAL